MTSEHASCTDCGTGDVICVDTDGGSCPAPQAYTSGGVVKRNGVGITIVFCILRL